MDRSRPSNKPRGRSSTYDHNNPIKTCKVCSTLGDWHCYECSNNFCSTHFHSHKQMQLCIIQ